MKNSEPSLELLHLLRRCGHYLHHHGGCGRASQFRALRILEDGGEMTQRQLQERMGIQQGSLSDLVKKLEDHGWITRQTSPDDRRQVLIQMTEEGSRQSRLDQARRSEEARELLGVLSQEEQERLRGLLTKLLEDWNRRQEGEVQGQ